MFVRVADSQRRRWPATGVVTLIGLLVAAAGAPASPAPASPGSVPAVEPASFTTSLDAYCAWVEPPSTSGHALPDAGQPAAGHWEIKVCGAPPGDTSGMGGPVDRRFVPDDGG